MLASKCRKCGPMVILWLRALVSISYSEEQKVAEHGNIDGEIIVDVVVPRENHNKFVISPRKGTISPFTESANSQLTGGGAVTHILSSCYTNPTSVSPNTKLVAACSGPPRGSTNDQIILRQADSKAIIYQSDLHQSIEDSEWSKDSKGIALLAMTVRVSLNPLYWFLALSGHPVQYETYFLHVIDVETLKVATFKLPIEGSSSGGYIVTWIQSFRFEEMKSSQIDHDNRLLGDGTGQTLTYTSGFRRELSRPSAEEEKGTATILGK